jgi:spermidine/putrescine transport system permease protein
MTPRSFIPSAVFATLVVLFLLSPLALVVLFSFGRNELTAFPMGDFTLRWYEALLDWDSFHSAFRASVIVSGMVGAISTVVGTLAALGLMKLKARWSGMVIGTLSLPLMLPPLVIGLALLSSFSWIGLKLGLWSVILAHLVFTQPFVVAVVHARLLGFDPAAIEAARDCGASPWRAFRTVVLPVISPSVIGGALIAMALSLDDFIVTFFTIGTGNTLSTLVWGMLRTTLDPSINALGTVILVLTLGMTILALRLTRYRG